MSSVSNCAYCGESDPPCKCSNCKTAKYCNRSCQSKDWKRHKVEDCTTVDTSKAAAKWIYSAPFKPYAYWISLGHDNHYASAMMDFQQQFSEAVYRMRGMTNVDEGTVIMNYPLESQNDNVSIVLHNNAFLPHWREVALGLKLLPERLGSKETTKSKGRTSMIAKLGIEDKGDDLPRDLKNIYLGRDDSPKTQLVFDRVELHKIFIDAVGPSLILNHFGSIRFEYNQFGMHGILLVIDLMRCNTSLKKVFLIGNEIDNEDDITSMSDVISNHPSLKEIHVNCACGNIKPNVFCSLIPASAQLTSLSLAGNNIKTNGSTIISNSLASNPALQELRLSKNKLNNDDAILIAAALTTNTNLWKLDLTSNDIDRIGYQALCKAVFNPESLNSVSSCNHTCDISSSDCTLCCRIPSFHGSILKGTRAAAIKLKQFALISPPDNDGDVNFSLMSDTPLELLQRVLFLVQAYPMRRDWGAIQKCLDGKAFLESSEDNHECNQFGFGRLSIPTEAERIPPPTEKDFERIRKRDEQLTKTRSLSIMFNVMKDLVVPILFSV